jgi:hypothetical protein
MHKTVQKLYHEQVNQPCTKAVQKLYHEQVHQPCTKPVQNLYHEKMQQPCTKPIKITCHNNLSKQPITTTYLINIINQIKSTHQDNSQICA